MDVSLSILKFAAVLIVGILGVIGLQVEYKKNGVITKWGRRALWGTVISTLVAIAIQSIETYKQHLDRIE
ncbi:MAG: hypothetical protein OEV08_15445, partial [Nitrospira sp.]|nr:hypothetical protein [Nitrospira sp.]